jgi:hypothetical protein
VLAAAIIPLVIVAGVVAAIAASGGSKPSQHASTRGSTHAASTPSHTASTPSHTASTASSGSTSSTPASTHSTASSSTPAAAGSATGAASAGSPTSAVERFYTLAASHDYGSAWALADPTFQSQLGGYRSFQGTMSATRSITFNSARVVSQSSHAATVAVRTTSVRSNGTQHCAGTVQLVPGSGGGWLLHQIGISCS